MQALVDTSDEMMTSDLPEMRGYALGSSISQVITEQIKAEPDKQKRADLVIEVIRHACALAGVVEIGWRELDDTRRNQVSPDYRLVVDERIEELRAELLPKFTEFAEVTLPSFGRYTGTYLSLWAEWGGNDSVAAWIRRRLATRAGFLALVECFWASRSSNGVEELFLRPPGLRSSFLGRK